MSAGYSAPENGPEPLAYFVAAHSILPQNHGAPALNLFLIQGWDTTDLNSSMRNV